MSTKPKRNYGPVRSGADATAGTNDSVFDKFFAPSSADNTSPPVSVSPPEIISPTPAPAQAPRPVGPTDAVSPADFNPLPAQLDLWAALTETKDGILFLPNQICLVLYQHLDPGQQAIYTQLYAKSWGYGNPTCEIDLPRLAKLAGMKTTAAHDAVKRLMANGLVVKEGLVFGKGKAQGVRYRLPLPERLAEYVRLARSGRLTKSADIKEEQNKDQKSFDAALCPDCKGTGYWYPDGHAKGVKGGCKHPKLREGK